MAAPLDFYTADMVRQLNEAEPRHWPRYETVHGELLVSPAPRPAHQDVVGNLYFALRLYLQHELAGHAYMAPADISWGFPEVLVQPDVFVVPTEERDAQEWKKIRHLLLAAEILSPSTARADRFTKRRLYQEQGTPLYWVIDANARTAEVWTPTDHFPRIEREQVVWHPAGASEPFILSLDELLAPA